MNKLEKFWNSCDTNFAHITLSRHLSGYESITNYWKKMFISDIDFNDKSVIEYGIGGAYLGKYLFENENIRKYCGIDISTRSIEAAAKNLLKFDDNTELYLTDYFYNNFNKTADVFVSQACIQHFTSLEYLELFLNKVNDLKCETVILQIRHSNTTEFISDMITEYEENDIVFACLTNKETILKYLTNYDLVKASDIDKVSKYQYLQLKLIK